MHSIDIGVSRATLPSAGAAFTYCTAICPPAPVLLSTTTVLA
jgi:hypothetical protein